jgi:hypothetical protein
VACAEIGNWMALVDLIKIFLSVRMCVVSAVHVNVLVLLCHSAIRLLFRDDSGIWNDDSHILVCTTHTEYHVFANKLLNELILPIQ